MAETETHRDNPTPAPVHVQDKGGSSTMLWLLLLLAIAAGLWWMNRDTAGSASNAPAPALDGSASTLPAPVAEEGTAAVAATAPAKKATATSKRTPAVRRDREPQLIASSQVMPRYPAAALRSGETGTVMVEVDVDSKGVPTDVSIENRSGNRELDRAALSAVKQWRFQPALRDGKQVASTVMVPVQFELDPASSMASN